MMLSCRWLALGTVLTVACTKSSIRPSLPMVAFVHAAVIPMDRERVLNDQTVLVIGDSIAAVDSTGKVRLPAGTRVIDATNQYILPGLIDSHVHVETAAFAQALHLPLPDSIPFERVLLPYLVHGVTAIRVMSGAPDLLAARDHVRGGSLLGPTMMVSSPMLDGDPPVLPPPICRVLLSPDSARQAVREYAAQGYDLIKLRNGLSRDVYDAIVDEARRVGIDVDGHIPRGKGMTIEHALTHGQHGIAHLEEFYYAAKNTDDSTAERFARLAKEGGVRVTTTLVVYPTILGQLANLDSVLAQREIADMYPLLVDAFWRRPGNPYSAQNTMDPATLRKGLAFQRTMLRALYAVGVPILAGSDALNPSILPGKGLWQELVEEVGSGLSPYQALRSATAVPAEQFSPFAHRGVVAPGRRADLIVLRRNPLDSIGNLSTIVGTMAGGYWLPVDGMRDRIHELARRR